MRPPAIPAAAIVPARATGCTRENRKCWEALSEKTGRLTSFQRMAAVKREAAAGREKGSPLLPSRAHAHARPARRFTDEVSRRGPVVSRTRVTEFVVAVVPHALPRRVWFEARAMRPLEESEIQQVFEKLFKFVGKNLKNIVDRADQPHCFRLHKKVSVTSFFSKANRLIARSRDRTDPSERRSGEWKTPHVSRPSFMFCHYNVFSRRRLY
jgi:hypothetical protein